MRIGISQDEPAGPQALVRLRDQLQHAAEDGFASAWVTNIFGLDALTSLAVAGSQVPGIELGTAVVPTYPRHPAVLAQQALTTATALDGRLTLGIGLSHKIVIEDMYGYSYDRPVRHMQEYLSILLPLLNGEQATFDGETMRASIGLTTPRPGRVPVLLAALGPQMLRLAGRLTDGTVLWMTGPATVRDHIVPTISEAAIYGQLPSYRAMLDREGAEEPGDIALIGDEQAVAGKIGVLEESGVTDFVAAQFSRGDDAERTRALLKSLLG